MADTSGGHKYSSRTWFFHLVAEYTGLDFLQIKRLNYIEYLQYRRDAFIQWLNKTEKGREYLDNAWRMEQTKPDRAGLRKKLGKGAPSNGI